MTIIVTGAAGFIGSNLVKALNARGEPDIIAVDNLSRAEKVAQPRRLEIADFIDKRDFIDRIAAASTARSRAVLHQGACSDTMETDGRYMMENNYRYSMRSARLVPGARRSRSSMPPRPRCTAPGACSAKSREHEAPLNVYGYSKFLFDQVVRRALRRGDRAGRGLPLLQRLRPARSAQGAHGLGRVPLLQPVPRRRAGEALRGQRRLRPGRAGARFRVASRTWCAVNLLLPRPSRGPRASSTSAPAARRPSTTWRAPRSTRSARARGERRDDARGAARPRAPSSTSPFPPQLVGKYQSYTQADMARAARTPATTRPSSTSRRAWARYVAARLAQEARMRWMLAALVAAGSRRPSRRRQCSRSGRRRPPRRGLPPGPWRCAIPASSRSDAAGARCAPAGTAPCTRTRRPSASSRTRPTGRRQPLHRAGQVGKRAVGAGDPGRASNPALRGARVRFSVALRLDGRARAMAPAPGCMAQRPAAPAPRRPRAAGQRHRPLAAHAVEFDRAGRRDLGGGRRDARWDRPRVLRRRPPRSPAGGQEPRIIKCVWRRSKGSVGRALAQGEIT